MVMREPHIGEAFIVLHESGSDHDSHAPTCNGSLSSRRPGDVVGHLPRVIALLTVLGVRTRGLRAGEASLLWPPNWTLCKMNQRRRRKGTLARETTVRGGSLEFDSNFREKVRELSPLGDLTDCYYSKT